MKKLKFVIPLTALFILGIFVTGIFFWWRENTKPVSNVTSSQDFLILKGKSASQVGQMLYEKGLIRSPLAFKIYVQVMGSADEIQAGEFRIPPNLTVFEVIDLLSKGPLELWVTVPEGLRKEEIVEKFTSGLQMNTSRAIEFRKEFLDASGELEGYLFPDTYLFPRDATGEKVVQRMKTIFDQKFDTDMKNKIQNAGRNLNQVVTMASIIERETKTTEERPIVAGILWKRSETKGWLVQADATTQYAIGTKNCSHKVECAWWPILTREDLEVDSLFNTYKFPGLPPFPIANPGITSLKSAVYPEESDYWFYIHDPDGKIHYAKTIQEHNQNIAKYLGK